MCYLAEKQFSCSWINVQKIMSVFVTYQEELVVSEVGPVILVALIMHLT